MDEIRVGIKRDIGRHYANEEYSVQDVEHIQHGLLRIRLSLRPGLPPQNTIELM